MRGNSLIILKITSLFFPPSQMTANILIFVAVNIVGIFVHNLMEHAQRRAFLDTRNCIAARIGMKHYILKRMGIYYSVYHFLICISPNRNGGRK